MFAFGISKYLNLFPYNTNILQDFLKPNQTVDKIYHTRMYKYFAIQRLVFR